MLQCVGHFLHEPAEGSKVVTLTLVTLIHLPNPNPNLIPSPNPDPNLIHNPNPNPDPNPYPTEGRPSDGVLRSDYPLLLLHAQVGVRRLPSPRGAEGSAHEAGDPLLGERARRAAEARQLGSDLESLLGLS